MIKWTKENCRELTLKYTSKSKFAKENNSCYNVCRKNNWWDEFSSHMEKVGNLYRRCIYSYEFEDNYVYIGLTFNHHKRNIQHLTNIKSSVYKHIKETNLNPIFLIKSDYININEAVLLEEKILNEYKNNNWNILNKAKTGAVGHNIKIWTKDLCYEEVKKYTTKNEFIKYGKGCYGYSKKEGFIEDLIKNLKLLKLRNYWTDEKCIEEANKYENKTDLKKYSVSCYNIIIKNKLFDKIPHLTNKDNTYWTKEKIDEVCKKYPIRKDLYDNENSVYCVLVRKGLLDKYYPFKKIKVYDLKGNLIEILDSLSSAGKKYNKRPIDIKKSCENKTITTNNLVFRYENDIFDYKKYEYKSKYKISVYDKNNKFIGIFDNVIEVTKNTNFNRTTIGRYIKRNMFEGNEICLNKYIFRYIKN